MTDAMVRLISDLIDFSSSGLGREMPLHREPSIGALCREVIGIVRAHQPRPRAALYSSGDVDGVGIAGRLRQVISN